MSQPAMPLTWDMPNLSVCSDVNLVKLTKSSKQMSSWDMRISQEDISRVCKLLKWRATPMTAFIDPCVATTKLCKGSSCKTIGSHVFERETLKWLEKKKKKKKNQHALHQNLVRTWDAWSLQSLLLPLLWAPHLRGGGKRENQGLSLALQGLVIVNWLDSFLRATKGQWVECNWIQKFQVSSVIL